MRKFTDSLRLAFRDVSRGYAFFLRNYYALARRMNWFLASIVYNTISCMAIIYIGVYSGEPKLTLNLFIGSIMWTYLSTIFDEISLCIANERWEGTIEYSFAAPVSRASHLFSISFFASVLAFIKLVALLVVCIPFFHIDFSLTQFLWLMVLILVSTFSFIGFGLIAAILPLISVESGAQAAFMFQGLLILISGVYYPVEVLPQWVQYLSVISPATYAIDACRKIFTSDGDIFLELKMLSMVAIVFIPVGLYVFSIAERWTKKVGKLKRNG